MSKYHPGLGRRFTLVFFFVAVALVASLSILALLQYRWVWQISEAERQRLQANVQLAADRFAEEFNGETLRTLVAMSAGRGTASADGPGAYGDLFLQWAATAPHPEIVHSVFVVKTSQASGVQLFRLDANSRLLEPASWPNRLQGVQRQLESAAGIGALAEGIPARPPELFLSDDPPMAIAPLFPLDQVSLAQRPGQFPFPPQRGGFAQPMNWVIVEFDQEVIVKDVFPGLVGRYFSSLGTDEYRVEVTTRTEPRRVVYSSAGPASAQPFTSADATAELLGNGFGLPRDRGGAVPPGLPSRFGAPSPQGLPSAGHWQIMVKHRLGSLNALAVQFRRRNMAASGGILAMLLTSVILIIVASERARKLARLQMEFAAGVSHELRSPLGVIQALSYNLAGGLVTDAADIQQYARMVQHEARGLGQIVEQVLLFAETRSNFQEYEVGPVEVVEVIDRALSVLAAEIKESLSEITVSVPDDIPQILANANPLANSIQNLVVNALKYGKRGIGKNIIRIEAVNAPADREVQLSVIDSGPGIAADELQHLCEPFYRGRAVTPGIRGAGLGLYLVKWQMEAQHGSLTIHSQRGAGSTFTLHIPSIESRFSHESL